LNQSYIIMLKGSGSGAYWQPQSRQYSDYNEAVIAAQATHGNMEWQIMPVMGSVRAPRYATTNGSTPWGSMILIGVLLVAGADKCSNSDHAAPAHKAHVHQAVDTTDRKWCAEVDRPYRFAVCDKYKKQRGR
jgi:hypothetical protein